jgi:hypothetical protein
MTSRNPSGVVSAGSSKLKTSADTIAAMPLIGNEVGIVAVRELTAMVLVEYFGLLRHQTSPAARSWPRA